MEPPPLAAPNGPLVPAIFSQRTRLPQPRKRRAPLNASVLHAAYELLHTNTSTRISVVTPRGLTFIGVGVVAAYYHRFPPCAPRLQVHIKLCLFRYHAAPAAAGKSEERARTR